MSKQREQWSRMLIENAVWDSVVQSRPSLKDNILDAMEQAVEAERAACAEIVKVRIEASYVVDGDRIYRNGWRHAAEAIEAEIRARGKA